MTVKDVKDTLKQNAAFFILHEQYTMKDCEAIRLAAGGDPDQSILTALKYGYVDGWLAGFCDGLDYGDETEP